MLHEVFLQPANSNKGQSSNFSASNKFNLDHAKVIQSPPVEQRNAQETLPNLTEAGENINYRSNLNNDCLHNP